MQLADTEQLKTFLIQTLEPICDADPDVLADYVLALLKHDKPQPELKTICYTQLTDFLGDETSSFIDVLFTELESASDSKSNNVNEPIQEYSQHQETLSSSNTTTNTTQLKARFGDDDDDDEEEDDDVDSRRKRRSARGGENIERVGDSDSQNNNNTNKRRRVDHQPSQSNGRFNQQGQGQNVRHHQQILHQQQQRIMPMMGFPQFPGQAGPWRTPAEFQQAMMNMAGFNPQMMAAAAQMRGGPGMIRHRPPRIKGRCFDYDEKGVCTRGDACTYDHTPLDKMNKPMNGQRDSSIIELGGGGSGNMNNMNGVDLLPQQHLHQNGFANRGGRGGMRGIIRGGRGGRGGSNIGRPAIFNSSTNRAYQNPDNKSIVVDKIPPEALNVASVNQFFSKFGTLTNINLQPEQARAILTYATYEEANAAYSSPDVIFDNRFVKVFWNKPDNMDTTPKDSPKMPTSQHHSQRGSKEDLHAQQEAATEAALELKKKIAEQERLKKLVEIQKQKEQVIQKQISIQKSLMMQLETNKNLSAEQRADIMKSLKAIKDNVQSLLSEAKTESAAVTEKVLAHKQEVIGSAATFHLHSENAEKDTTTNTTAVKSLDNEQQVDPALVAKLESLKKEAAEMGLSSSHSPSSFRGGFSYSRGRGRGGAFGASRFKLDNRTTKLHITGTGDATSDSINEQFKNYGQIESVEAVSDGFILKYRSRREAEVAAARGTRIPEFPNLKIEWFNDPATMPSSLGVNLSSSESQ